VVGAAGPFAALALLVRACTEVIGSGRSALERVTQESQRRVPVGLPVAPGPPRLAR